MNDERAEKRQELSYLMLTCRLVHNHPSGDPSPSTADVRLTQEIIAIAKPMGITVQDHLIVGRNGHNSLKALNYM